MTMTLDRSGIAPRGDWMDRGYLTGRRGGLILRNDSGKWVAVLDGVCFGGATVTRYGDADYIEAADAVWEYSLDNGEADRVIARGVPVIDRR